MQFGMKYWPNEDGISISERLRTVWRAGGGGGGMWRQVPE